MPSTDDLQSYNFVLTVLGSTEGTYLKKVSGVTVIDGRSEYTGSQAGDKRNTFVSLTGTYGGSLDNSGLTFGVTQMDTATNPAAFKIFSTLVDQAVAAGRISALTGEDYKARAAVGAKDPNYQSVDKFNRAELETINAQVLAYGHDLINQGDLTQAAAVLASLGRIQKDNGYSGVLDPGNIDNPTAMAWLAAWRNQHGYLLEVDQALQDLGHPPTLQELHDILKADGFRNFDKANQAVSYYDLHGSPFSLSCPVGSAISLLETGLQNGNKDPLVLDLTGDGVSLTNVDGSNTYFDISGSSMSSLTAWATGGDGILCLDPGNTGVISSVDQLIGSDTGNGFYSLTAFDSNGDGQITSSDTNWGDLRVFIPDWGINTGGLYTLSALGITSISLAAVDAGYDISGNNITQSSTFTMNGNTHVVDDVWLSYSTVNTTYSGSYTLDPDTLFLPEVRGYGDLPDLSIAMSLDSTLKSEVADVASQNAADVLDPSYAVEDKIEAIMFEWAGVTGESTTDLGDGFTDQKLAFMQAYMGQSFNVSYHSYNFAEALFETIRGIIGTDILAQSGLANILSHPVYDPTTDTFSGGDSLITDNSMVLHFHSSTDSRTSEYAYLPTVGVLGELDDVYVFREGDTSGAGGVVSIIGQQGQGHNAILLAGVNPNDVTVSSDSGDLYINYSATDTIHVHGNENPNTGESLAGQYMQEIYFDDGTSWNLSEGMNLTSTSTHTTQIGTVYGDTMTGAAASSSLYAYGGNDTLVGGANPVYMYGGLGDDTYSFTAGTGNGAIIHEDVGEGTETIALHNVNPVDVKMWTDGGNLYVGYDSTNTVEVLGGADPITGELLVGEHVEQIKFDDATIWDLTGGLNLTSNSAFSTQVGTAYGDTMTGTVTDTILFAYGGNDTLIGEASIGPVYMYGGLGDDTYIINDTGDHIIENADEGTDLAKSSVSYSLGNNAENLTLTGTSALTGTGNNLDNILTDNGQADTLIGSTGNDTYVITTTSDVITENTSEGTDFVQAAFSYTLGSNLEGLTLLGTSALTGTGNSLNNILISNGHADTLIGGTGNDTYIITNTNDLLSEASSAGTDLIVANFSYTLGTNFESLTLSGTSALVGTGNSVDNVLTDNGAADTLIGGAGNDTYVISNASDLISEASSAGTDLVISSASYTLATNLENLTMTGSANLSATGNTVANIITGNTGNDVLDGGAGADTMVGNSASGSDTFIVDSTADSLTETNTGTASLVKSSVNFTLGAHFVNLTLTGASALTGTGNTLANVLTDNGAADTLIGGAGNDTYVVSNTGDLVSEASSAGTDLVQSSVSFTLATNVENLTLIGGSALTGTGNTLANVLTDNGAADTLIGGTGNDTYVVSNTGDLISEAASAGTDLVQSSVNFTLAANVENLTLLGTSALTATGNTLGNVITANTGNSLIDGGAGADTMVAAATGNDTFIVDNTGDVVTGNASGGIDLVKSSVSFTLGNYLDNLTLTGVSALIGTGNSLANILTDNGAADTLIGGAGNDTYVVSNTGDLVSEASSAGTDLVQSSVSFTLAANVENLTLMGGSALTGTGNTLANVLTDNGAADTLIGGTGNDTYIVSNASDLVSEASSAGTDVVISSVSLTLATNVEKLTLTGSANLSGTGNSSANTITGNTGNNVLDGGSGADTIVGNSTSGADTFVVDNAGDSITEVNSGTGALVQSSVNWTLGVNFNALTLTGSSARTGIGNSSKNILTSNTGADTLVGNSVSGDDTFVVNNTADSLTEVNTATVALVQSNVSWTLGANFNNLTLLGASALVGTGNSLANILTDNGAADTLIGGAGNDTYIVSNTSDLVSEGASAGTDLVKASVSFTLATNVENLTLFGSSALVGTGNSVANVLTDNGAADTLVGGAGDDTYIVSNASDLVSEASSAGTDLVKTSVSFTLATNLENLTLLGSSALVGTGNSVANVLTDNGAADTLVGGAGDDTYIVSNASDLVSEASSAGTDLVETSLNYTLGANLENLILTGSSNLSGTGNTLANIITGNTGDDILDGGVGTDTLIGNSTWGNDTFVVDNTGDSLTETNAAMEALVQSSVSWTLGDNFNNLTLLGTSALVGMGNGFDNTLTDNGASDTLIGGTGDDTYIISNTSDLVSEAADEGTDLIEASFSYTLGTNFENLKLLGTSALIGTGNSLDNILVDNGAADTLIGGAGDDTYVISNTSDLVSEASSAGTDLVVSSVSYTLASNIEGLTLTGSGITGTANNGGNVITDNSFSGGNTLVGGAGADEFVLASAGVYNNIDVIQNFSTAQSDKIDIIELMPDYYISGVSTLADYVRAVNSGSDSLLQVDSTGTGNNFQTVATITGVTGINVATYVTNGNLVV